MEAISISKKYKDKTILHNVSFTLAAGQAMAIVGDNGAGKSTLMQILASMVTPTAGDVRYRGKSIFAEPSVIRQAMSYVPQEIALHQNLRVIDNLRFWADMSGLSSAEKKARIPALAERFGLTEHMKTPVSKLSGGLRRRLNICISLFRDPEIIFLDEPTANVDGHTKDTILEWIGSMKQEGKTIIYITHLHEEARQLADRVLQLEDGRVCYDGDAAAFFSGRGL